MYENIRKTLTGKEMMKWLPTGLSKFQIKL